jgi:hypothetical protein
MNEIMEKKQAATREQINAEARRITEKIASEWYAKGYCTVPERMRAQLTERQRWATEQYDALADEAQAVGKELIFFDTRRPMPPGWYMTLENGEPSAPNHVQDSLTEERLRTIIRQELKAAMPAHESLLNAEQAAAYLGYDKFWVYRHWQKLGGKKISGKGLRFDRADLERWAKTRGLDA